MNRSRRHDKTAAEKLELLNRYKTFTFMSRINTEKILHFVHFRKRRLLKPPRIKSKTGCPEVDLLTEFHCITVLSASSTYAIFFLVFSKHVADTSSLLLDKRCFLGVFKTNFTKAKRNETKFYYKKITVQNKTKFHFELLQNIFVVFFRKFM